ncbi:MAG TPA: penicillin-binding protein 2 [Opitutaceae bacterium]|nr:penicillin-binding protein 2 [Opitutaceae bacterium]
MSRGFASNYRIVLLATLLFACFAGLGTRLVWLHVIDRDALLQTIIKTRRQVIQETARRGDIFDRNGAILAANRPLILVAVDPTMMRPQDLTKLPELAKLVGKPLAEVQRICTTRYRTLAPKKPMLAKLPAAPAAAASSPLRVTLNLGDNDGDSDVDPDFGRAMSAANSATTDSPDVSATADADDDAETDTVTDQQGRRPIRWAKLSNGVPEDTFAEIQKLGIAGLCGPERRYARVYPHNELAAHIVGFANRQGRGIAGIEAYDDFYLRGQDGWREGEKDGRRRELAQFQTRNVPRADGYNVVLSIDSVVQDIVERELDHIAQTFAPLKATIIVSDPRTGFILAMANYPTFNLNEYNRVPKDQMVRMKNVAVADVYEPGSVFKIVAASAALEEGLVTPQTVFNCAIDRVDYQGRTLRLPGEAERFPHQEAMTVADIIAESSNRGAAQLGMLLGKQRLYDYARKFGFGSPLGFPAGGEVAGILAPPAKWYPIDITRIPMGQSIAATALQMHAAMSVIANHGVLLRPQVISEIRDASNNVVYQYPPAEITRVISARTALTVNGLLRRVTEDGTAPQAAIKIGGVDYEVAGKTGTAQKLMSEPDAHGRMVLRYSHTHHVGSFIGFFPASRPQVEISVIVDDADGRLRGGWGAQVAAPSFRRIGEKLIPILSITAPNQPARADFVAATEGGHR